MSPAVTVISSHTAPDSRIPDLIDSVSVVEEVRVPFALVTLKRLADDTNDDALDNVVRCQGNVFLIFEDVHGMEAPSPQYPTCST